MILLYTDFGTQGPYVGQMHAVLAQRAPGVPVIDLMHDAPAFNPRAAGALLAALARQFPPQSICIAVIDPGVGGERRAVAVQAGGHRFVGPDNGLFEYLSPTLGRAEWFEIQWRPDGLSDSFHGRDLFAPIAAALALDQAQQYLQPIAAPDKPTPKPPEVIYIDAYGNAMTGLSGDALEKSAVLHIAGHSLSHARVFSDADPGQAFWTVNSQGLVEVAVNQGSATRQLELQIGTPVDTESA